MNISGTFLEAILPESGWKCAAIFEPGKKKPRHVFARTAQELAVLLENADAHGSTVYHACASYREPSARTRANVDRLKSLWLDVDAGRGKPFADVGSAVAALAAFLGATGLPEPILVGSGNGAHVYWPLERELTLDEWQPLADNLKALCRQHGFEAGPERTADAASILRPPGSHHRKDPNNVRMVTGGAPRGPYPLSHFRPAGVGRPGLRADGRGHTSHHPVQPARGSLTADLLNTWLDDPADPIALADQCAQIGAMRASRGDHMPEPLWHACLNALAFCRDGAALAHEWSKGDDRYDPAEVDAKLARAKALTGPTLCSRFDELNSSLCARCVHRGKLSSPVSLGRSSAPEPVSVQPPAEAEALEPLPDPFIWGPNGAVLFAMEKGGRATNVMVTQYPVVVRAVGRSEGGAHRHLAVLRHWRPHEGWKEAEVPMKALASSQSAAEVAAYGIVVHEADLWRRYVRQSIDNLAAKEASKVIYEQFGWKNDRRAFLLGNRLYANGAYVDVACSQELNHRARHLRPGGMKGKGDLLGWKAAADRLGAPGSEAQLFAIVASAAAPLMHLYGGQEGGAIVSLVSHSGGRGKTTALNAAATFWGDPSGLEMIAIDTRVAKGITLGAAGNAPIVFDELRERDPESLRDFVQMFTTGRDKLRGTQEGTLVHTASAWQTILITASNKSLVEAIRQTQGSTAMATRILEFDMPQLQNNLDLTLDRRLLENPGWAGERYLQGLTLQDPNVLQQALEQSSTALVKQHQLASTERFWARALGAVRVAGILLDQLGILSFSPDRLVQWAITELLREARRLRVPDDAEEPSGFRPTEDAINTVLHMLGDFVSNHLDCVLTVEGAPKRGHQEVPVRVPTRRVLMRLELKTQRLFIHQAELRKWFSQRDMSWTEARRCLLAAGVMEPKSAPVSLGAGTTLPTLPVPAFVTKLDHPRLFGLTPVMKPAVVPMG